MSQNPRKIREISTVEALLQCLRKKPALRIVTYVNMEWLAVVEFPHYPSRAEARVIAWVADGSEAATLTRHVWGRAVMGQSVRAELPLRYGPGCSEYCLPEHPEAVPFEDLATTRARQAVASRAVEPEPPAC